MPGNFYDTNILLHLASGDATKAAAAERVVDLGGAISIQVLNEFVHVARRKMGFSWEDVYSFITTIRALLTVVPLTIDIHDKGLQLAERYNFSIYDAMIVAAALSSDCDTLFSEDLQEGMQIEGLSIVNPLQNT
ncbi:putative nucleic acid-binding protein [Neorhizobium sp. R1-B]|uniref:PIN domain-containing protein n=1 Tax=unclassified Neorhizobium TaxID=2629175 RepID=UPI00104D796E|nr:MULTISPECIES: PIN domain-containing protein [unclassified Neorhizobium]TCV66370.1 putative nucleic acid-binding protein [Neorhizobium sp. S3-V5DH]TDX74610.1 putative nucleic acid-binding protein [Neorhizobium sp. R1-B]